jgi:hypothetical protein
LIGQTKDIAPADKLIYSLRDVTATVESIPLITASIMSKKLAEGIDGLVLDIKTGNGAFMKDQKDSEALAFSLIKSANDFDKKVIAFITDMNQPLGNCMGNWLEVGINQSSSGRIFKRFDGTEHCIIRCNDFPGRKGGVSSGRKRNFIHLGKERESF